MIFVDTWAWVALADRHDQYHPKAKVAHKQLTAARRQYVTTDYVLSETITYLYGTLAAPQAQSFIAAILQAATAGTYQLVHITPAQFDRAWQMRVKYHDKPTISFVDFASMVVMQDLGISEVFTGDQHFLHVGLGFHLGP